MQNIHQNCGGRVPFPHNPAKSASNLSLNSSLSPKRKFLMHFLQQLPAFPELTRKNDALFAASHSIEGLSSLFSSERQLQSLHNKSRRYP
ncbi:hypothetical protein [Paenibacillus alginolyticus]|uniref:hypothetical protein n=1 Tax=Paenibacillus alginolyticus TaxID=59839 RepID=UPI002DB909FD|nr:hypothetical protein [Paenibacillus alginolyticus]MEC0147766.1 hypothetical protein [Paenibacillus alginolyticus]